MNVIVRGSFVAYVLLMNLCAAAAFSASGKPSSGPRAFSSRRRYRDGSKCLIILKSSSGMGGGDAIIGGSRRKIAKSHTSTTARRFSNSAEATSLSETEKLFAEAGKPPKSIQGDGTSVQMRLPRRRNGGTRGNARFSSLRILDHDLLTKEEELDLGAKVRRANQLREAVEELLDEDDAIGSTYGMYDEDENGRRSFEALGAVSRLETMDRGSLLSDGDGASSLECKLQAFSDDEIVARLGVARTELLSLLIDGAVAKDSLIRKNIRLVVSVAKKWAQQAAPGSQENTLSSAYSGAWGRPSLDEAVQEGVLGLAHAADKFEPERNLRFSTYATWWVTNYVRRCFRRASTGSIRVPVAYHDTKRQFMTLLRKYCDTQGESPSMDVLADEMGLKRSRLDFVLRMTRPPVSTDMPLKMGRRTAPGKAGGGGYDDALAIADTLVDTDNTSPEEQVEISFLRQSLESAMASELAPHERDILRLRLGLDDGVSRSRREIAEEFGYSLSMREIRSAESRAYKKLRSPHALSTYKLLAYLDFAGADKSTMTLR